MVIVGSTALPSAASATGPDNEHIVGNATGAGWIPGERAHYTPQERRDARTKSRLWVAYADLIDGRISEQQFRRTERRAQRALPSDRVARGRPEGIRGCTPQDPTCLPPKHLMAVPHRKQINNYFCGPAAGTMIAAYAGKKRSAKTGARLSQKHMGSRKHMKTWKNEVTRYVSKLWTRGLNRWFTGRRRGPYTQVDNPRIRTFRGALLYTTKHTKPLGVSTVENKYGAKPYNNHEFSTDQYIGHWLVSRGYGKRGRRTYFLDTSTSVWRDAHKRFRYNTKRFVKRYVDNGIAGRGIVG